MDFGKTTFSGMFYDFIIFYQNKYSVFIIIAMCKDLGNNTYECSGTCGANGSVWGTGLYTADSNVYAAAKHMGITPGRFLKTMLPGFSAYLGVALNGVTTLSYHNYGSSFILSKI